MRKSTQAAAVLFALLIPVASLAQEKDAYGKLLKPKEPRPPLTASSDFETCKVAGKEDGGGAGFGGAFAGGIFGGVLLGPLGVLVAPLFQSGNEAKEVDVARLCADTSTECRMAYREGFKDASKGSKQTAAVIGAGLGALVFIMIVAVANQPG